GGGYALLADFDDPVPRLPACERLFHFLPPQRCGDTDERTRRLLAAMDESPRHMVYISTTGVYGDCGDELVTEERAVAPTTERARRRVDAEEQILAQHDHAVILRVPGIYGPGRLPIARIRAAEPVLADAAGGWSNRIHIDDLAAIAWQAGGQHWPHNIYNTTDGRPTRMSAYHDTLAELLGVPAPPRVDWAAAQQHFSAMRLSFLRESRYLSNARLRHDFGHRFMFADFRDGLTASLRAEPQSAATSAKD